jgi:6-phosphofructokinase
LRRIGAVTSGGDAPGVNVAIRAIVRVAYSKKLPVSSSDEIEQLVVLDD